MILNLVSFVAETKIGLYLCETSLFRVSKKTIYRRQFNIMGLLEKIVLFFVPTACSFEISVCRSRNPKLLLISSSSTTTTLSTTTLCYSTQATLTTCTGRKKRAVYTDPVTGETGELGDIINPDRLG